MEDNLVTQSYNRGHLRTCTATTNPTPKNVHLSSAAREKSSLVFPTQTNKTHNTYSSSKRACAHRVIRNSTFCCFRTYQCVVRSEDELWRRYACNTMHWKFSSSRLTNVTVTLRWIFNRSRAAISLKMITLYRSYLKNTASSVCLLLNTSIGVPISNALLSKIRNSKKKTQKTLYQKVCFRQNSSS